MPTPDAFRGQEVRGEEDTAISRVTTIRDYWMEQKFDEYNNEVAAWKTRFLETHSNDPDAHFYQLYQVLIGGTPQPDRKVDLPDRSIENFALALDKKLREN